MSRLVMLLIYTGILCILTSLVHYYLWKKLVKDPQLTHWKAKWIKCFLVGAAVAIPLSVIARITLSFEISRYVVYAPYLWMGLILISCTFFISLDLCWLIYHGWEKLTRKIEAVDSSRRLFLKRSSAGIVSASTISLGGHAYYHEKRVPPIKDVAVKLNKFPAAMNGFTIVQITDLHIGLTRSGVWLQGIVDQINELQPDLVAITGDLVDGTPKQLLTHLQPLSDLKSKYGVYFVTGNHEYYSGVDDWMKVWPGLGLQVLHNERVMIGSGDEVFALLGVDDYTAERLHKSHRSDLDKAAADLDPKYETILLAHQPKTIYKAAALDVGLLLTGHTHGGQIWPFTHIVDMVQPYLKGLHQHGKRTQIYVSEGTGVWGPTMRLGTDGEITRFSIFRS